MNHWLIKLILRIVGAGLICFVLWYIIGYANLGQPFDKVLRVLVMVGAGVFLIWEIINLMDGKPPQPPAKT